MTDIAPSPCISWMTIGSDSWGQCVCPTAIGYRRKERLLRFNISTAIPGAEGKLIQAKYFGKVRHDINLDNVQ
jgi:hypothetical protein